MTTTNTAHPERCTYCGKKLQGTERETGTCRRDTAINEMFA